MTLISLIGEQPIPNILPALHLKPSRLVLIYTNRTKKQALNLEKFFNQKSQPDTQIETVLIPIQNGYNLAEIADKLRPLLATYEGVAFNLTGGTKPMALAGYQLAQEKAAPVLYLETEGKRSFLYKYQFPKPFALPNLSAPVELPELICIDDYLNAFLPGYSTVGFSKAEGGRFENAIYDALNEHVDEQRAGIKPKGAGSQIDIDLMVRIKNQVAVIEIKDKHPLDEPKKGIDQLNTIGGREYLGIYTAKILVSSTKLSSDIHALAKERKIEIIELLSFRTSKKISPKDQKQLIEAITGLLTPQE
ncbi:MAG TPA: DUF1887 family CARF protein [Rhodothermales bacterium]|nr:hypothetical protein [Bacteroidota bacterium]HRK73462.1 DUF1887 family CARF protein [Rhodothermales bacterium]HRR07710.1 DUF1887 family CARF protein [Rhodothermales bacterium]